MKKSDESQSGLPMKKYYKKEYSSLFVAILSIISVVFSSSATFLTTWYFCREKLKVYEFETDKSVCFVDSVIKVTWKTEGADCIFLKYANTKKNINPVGSETITVRDSLLSYDGRFYIELISVKKEDTIKASNDIDVKVLPPGTIRVQPPVILYSAQKSEEVPQRQELTPVTGRVVDKNGQGIPGITVFANSSCQTMTDSTGYFELPIENEIRSGLIPLYFSGGGYENLRLICSTKNQNPITFN